MADEPIESPWDPDAMAELDREIADNDRWWKLGTLALDPATGRTPALPIHTAAGDTRLDLNDPRVRREYTVTSGAAIRRGRSVLERAPETVEDDAWHLISSSYPLRWDYIGELVTSPPLSAPGEALAAGLAAIGSDGESLRLEGAGVDRWLLAPGFGYKLAYDPSAGRWLVSEMAGWDDAMFGELSAEP